MKTYFIRHSESCDIGSELRDLLWKRKMIAIHYEDKRSWYPMTNRKPSSKASFQPNVIWLWLKSS
jgi:hypothetical protein